MKIFIERNRKKLEMLKAEQLAGDDDQEDQDRDDEKVV